MCMVLTHSKSNITSSLDPCGSQPKLIALHRHLSAMSICLNEPGDLQAIDLCSRANGWRSCPKNKHFQVSHFLAFNAAATICMVPYTFIVLNHQSIHRDVADT